MVSLLLSRINLSLTVLLPPASGAEFIVALSVSPPQVISRMRSLSRGANGNKWILFLYSYLNLVMDGGLQVAVESGERLYWT